MVRHHSPIYAVLQKRMGFVAASVWQGPYSDSGLIGSNPGTMSLRRPVLRPTTVSVKPALGKGVSLALYPDGTASGDTRVVQAFLLPGYPTCIQP